MSLTPRQAQLLDHLAITALDALRDQDRLALAAATELHSSNDAHDRARAAAVRAQLAEQRLIDAIHALVRHTPDRPAVDQLPEPRFPAPRRRWTAFLGR